MHLQVSILTELSVLQFKTMGSRELQKLLQQRREGLEDYDPDDNESQNETGNRQAPEIPGARPQYVPSDPESSGICSKYTLSNCHQNCKSQ